jgi:hypothetical protein
MARRREAQLSEEWHRGERATWRGLLTWGYVFLAACAVPIPLRHKVPDWSILAWYALALVGYVVLGAWLAMRIRRSVSRGRAELAERRHDL